MLSPPPTRISSRSRGSRFPGHTPKILVAKTGYGAARLNCRGPKLAAGTIAVRQVDIVWGHRALSSAFSPLSGHGIPDLVSSMSGTPLHQEAKNMPFHQITVFSVGVIAPLAPVIDAAFLACRRSKERDGGNVSDEFHPPCTIRDFAGRTHTTPTPLLLSQQAQRKLASNEMHHIFHDAYGRVPLFSFPGALVLLRLHEKTEIHCWDVPGF